MAKKRTIVGENLTPTVLKELGGVDKFPTTPADFQPEGNWTNKYRIWTCHGYRESSNEDRRRKHTAALFQPIGKRDSSQRILAG